MPSLPRPHLGAVHHLAVCVEDLPRAEAFYVGVLGLSVLRRWDDDRGQPRSVWLALDASTFLAVERAKVGAPTRSDEAPGWHCVALAIDVSDRERWRAHLRGHGVEVERETDYTLYVRDPEGALVALSHFPRERSGQGASRASTISS
jgi:glyoxylase I family protein